MSAFQTKRFAATKRAGVWLDLSGNNYVRRHPPIPMEWPKVDLSCYLVASAPFGGPIALRRATDRIVQTSGKPSNEILIFSRKGRDLAYVDLPPGSKVEFMWWTDREHLCVVMGDAYVHFFNIHGDPVTDPVQLPGPPACWCGHPHGIVVVTKDLACVNVESTPGSQDVMYRLRTTQLGHHITLPPSSLTAISPDVSESANLEVFIATSEGEAKKGTILKVMYSSSPQAVDLDVRRKTQWTGAGIHKLAASPDGTRIAMFASNGALAVLTADGKTMKNIGSVAGRKNRQFDLTWCGEHCVVMCVIPDPDASFEEGEEDADELDEVQVLAFDPRSSSSEVHEIPLDSEDDFVCLLPEADGVWVLSGSTITLIEQLPDCIQRIFTYGSQEPSACLMTSYDQYMLGMTKAVRTVRQLVATRDGHRERLELAIEDCIEAAGCEFDIEQQKRLLSIASYGKCFCQSFDTDTFVDMCRRVRVLNALRNSNVSILLTLKQYRAIETKALVTRLISQYEHQLAFKVCEYLNLSPERVVLHWACLKVQSDDTQENIKTMVINKLRLCPHVSYAEVVKAAHNANRPELAISILQADPSSANQVPMMLKMKNYELALEQATASGHPCLIFMALQRMKEQREKATIFGSLSREPLARDMFVKYCLARESMRDLVGQHYLMTQQPQCAAQLVLLQYFKDSGKLASNFIFNASAKPDGWRILHEYRQNAVKTAQNMLSGKKDHEGEAKLLVLQSALLDEQAKLASETKDLTYLNATTLETIRLCYRHGKTAKAEAIQKKFGVPDKMIWWAKLQALAAGSDWDGIDKMGGGGRFNTKVKCPIGFQPFVQELLKYGRHEQAAGYVQKIPDVGDRVEAYIMCRAWGAAAEDCIKQGELEALEYLKDRAKSSQAATQAIERAIQQSGKRR